MELFLALVILAIGVALYFLPTLIAGARNHPQGGPILIVNFFLGWTVIGWPLILAWACWRFTAPGQPSSALPQS